jgi:hypothetical protein
VRCCRPRRRTRRRSAHLRALDSLAEAGPSPAALRAVEPRSSTSVAIGRIESCAACGRPVSSPARCSIRPAVARSPRGCRAKRWAWRASVDRNAPVPERSPSSRPRGLHVGSTPTRASRRRIVAAREADRDDHRARRTTAAPLEIWASSSPPDAARRFVCCR